MTFTSFDFPGSVGTDALGINSEGEIVGLYDDGATRGYLLSHGVFTTIDFPGAERTAATGISSRGDIVGWYNLDGVRHGFLLNGFLLTR